ncbi:MBL fold metallo-hydrolase [Methanoregula sp.]|uniref:MBL fold metallo-hydrolase n=1 Tax=Methanoregula sp. TaxID=2052170 RepID=UPI003561CC06
MKVTILMDNTALFDRMFVAEHGFSAYIEAEGKRILFDTGYSGAFLQNAEKMKIDLFDLDYIVLSHGHFDHTGGLWHLIHRFMEAAIEETPHRLPRLIAHPCCFLPRPKPPLGDIGPVFTADEVQRAMPLELSESPVSLTPNLFFLGEIERKFPFEDAAPGSRRIVMPDGSLQEDRILDDTSLAFRGRDGLVVITGCAHAGICNTVEYAKKICGEERVNDIVGGLHLRTAGPQLDGTLAYLKDRCPDALHACHCTSLAAKVALAQVTPLQETGVGLRLEYADR